MGSLADQLCLRTREFAAHIIEFVRPLPRTEEARIISRQLIRSATSVAANYRAVCRARSKAEFVAKIGLVIEETDESAFWLEMLIATRNVPEDQALYVIREANEPLAIFAASYRTARKPVAP